MNLDIDPLILKSNIISLDFIFSLAFKCFFPLLQQLCGSSKFCRLQAIEPEGSRKQLHVMCNIQVNVSCEILRYDPSYLHMHPGTCGQNLKPCVKINLQFETYFLSGRNQKYPLIYHSSHVIFMIHLISICKLKLFQFFQSVSSNKLQQFDT